MHNGESFREEFLAILNKKRVKIENKFKYILSLVNFSNYKQHPRTWLSLHNDIDSIAKSNEFKQFLGETSSKTCEFNNFSYETSNQIGIVSE